MNTNIGGCDALETCKDLLKLVKEAEEAQKIAEGTAAEPPVRQAIDLWDALQSSKCSGQLGNNFRGTLCICCF